MSPASRAHAPCFVEAMLIFTDVSEDPTAFTRSRLRAEQLAEARALGFESIAWIAMAPKDPAPGMPPDQAVTVFAAIPHRDAPMTLSVLHLPELGDDYCVRTLFTDGSIVTTGSEPRKNRVRLRLGVTSAPKYGVDLAFVAMTSLADLVDEHTRRVREKEAQGATPFPRHDLRTHFAIALRWREIADARMRRQTSIAIGAGIVTLAATLCAPLFALRPLASLFGDGIAYLVVAAAAMFGVSLAFGAFTAVLLYVAPILARSARAPAQRPAEELLPVADSVARGTLAPLLPARPSPVAVPLAISPAALSRLQGIDLVVSSASALLLPIAVLTSLALGGLGMAWLALSIVLALDGLVLIMAKKGRTEVLRERFVPQLVRAEASSVSATACEGAACALAGRTGGWIRLLIGAAGLLAAHRVLAISHEAVPLHTAAPWALAAVSMLTTAITRTRKRHKQLVAS